MSVIVESPRRIHRNFREREEIDSNAESTVEEPNRPGKVRILHEISFSYQELILYSSL
jgi:hypothetical protein